jgi:hypothetical protein
MFIYVIATWLLANLIHPFMLILVFGWNAPFDMNSFGLLFQLFLYSLVCSIPSIVFSQLAIYGIFKLPFHTDGKYITWLLIAPFLVIFNYWFLMIVFTGEIYGISLEFMLPAMLSVALTILIRYAAFFRTAAELNNKHNETGMV